jgi:CDGSH-type Zn-finger protein
MAEDRPHIRILTDGPYVVRGGVPLARTEQVETEYGEPVDWAPLEPIEAEQPRNYQLCRCGMSKTKPFCDDSHEEGFDGTEVADREPRATRADIYVGEGVVMTDDRSLCTMAGYCGDRYTKVWQMIRRTGDPQVRERLQQMVSLCPSGSLAWAPAQGEDEIEPKHEPSVVICRDGPILVRGGVQVKAADGWDYEVRNRVTLCRCGRSENKPFCDGSHNEVGFTDD